ncbi:hypothetical protein, partial [Clavibacter michiganensis]|uniref:hypothetical protein n=1 Tax=Clavibacter michiganensis TaxID=28447 RepID=UPI002931C3C1
MPATGAPVAGTILCVHGNPTWSYLWRRIPAGALAGAGRGPSRPARRRGGVHHLPMGLSPGTGLARPPPLR